MANETFELDGWMLPPAGSGATGRQVKIIELKGGPRRAGQEPGVIIQVWAFSPQKKQHEVVLELQMASSEAEALGHRLAAFAGPVEPPAPNWTNAEATRRFSEATRRGARAFGEAGRGGYQGRRGDSERQPGVLADVIRDVRAGKGIHSQLFGFIETGKRGSAEAQTIAASLEGGYPHSAMSKNKGEVQLRPEGADLVIKL